MNRHYLILGNSINYGIKTGFNKAFIVDNATKDALVAKDPRSEEILKPILRGRDIKRYRADWAGLWVIGTFPALNLDINDYPAVKSHLLSFGAARLEQTGETGSRKKTGNQWFETSDSIAYHAEFMRDKIVWSDISTSPTFTVSEAGVYVSNTVYMLATAEKHILAILNSSLVKYYFPLVASGLGNEGNRYFKVFVEQIPIPKLPISVQRHLADLADKCICGQKAGTDIASLEKEIDALMYKHYELTDAEIATVEGKVQV